jgi:hypothetical protein
MMMTTPGMAGAMEAAMTPVTTRVVGAVILGAILVAVEKTPDQVSTLAILVMVTALVGTALTAALIHSTSRTGTAGTTMPSPESGPKSASEKKKTGDRSR